MSEQSADPAQDSVQHAATTRDHVRRLIGIRKRAIQGDELATQRQHSKDKLTARQRLEHLLDSGSFTEFDLFRRRATGPRSAGPFTDGVVTGAGTVHGRRVFAYAQDFLDERRYRDDPARVQRKQSQDLTLLGALAVTGVSLRRRDSGPSSHREIVCCP